MKAISPEQSIVVIPTYEEAENIRPLIARIMEVCRSIHILVIDDNSRDGTADIVKALQKNYEQIHLIQRQGKLGLGSAYICGFKWAIEQGFANIIEMDADFSHDPQVLPNMITNLKSSDVVIGSRYVPGGGTENWNFFRKCISKFGSFYARTILSLPVYDLTGGFNGWRRRVLQNIDLDTIRSEGYSFQIELKYRAFRNKFKLTEIPILFSERREGHSKMSGRIIIEALFRVWTFRFHKLSLPQPSDVMDNQAKASTPGK